MTTASPPLRPRVLMVDDSMALRAGLCELLRGAGFELVACSSVSDANAALSRESFDLIVLEGGADALAGTMAELGDVFTRSRAATRFVPSAGRDLVVGTKRILAVDDDASRLEELTQALEGADHNVLLARSGAEALELLTAQRVDGIVLHLRMAGITGLCAQIRAIATLSDVPLLIMTSHQDHATMIEALHAGADDFIVPSNGFDILGTRLVAHLRRRHVEDETRRLGETQLRREVEATEARAEHALASSRMLLTSSVERDRSELARINQELEAARAQAAHESNFKSRFLASMSHELRTPLNAIIGFSELLEQEIPGKLTTTQKEYIQNVLSSGHHLLELINDILDLSKIEAGRMDLRFAWQSLTTVVDAVAGSVQALADRRGVTFAVDISPEVPDLFIDLVRVRQVLFNLLSNAVKFTPPGGLVNLSARKRGKLVSIAVHDTGIGIRAEDLPRIFREFEQVQTLATDGGTGLGLALAQKLVELHGGEITVESAEGQGSTFTVQLPVLRPTSGGSVANTLDVDTPPGSLVLVIEDDAKAAELLTNHLATAGVSTVCIIDAEIALDQARTLKPAAITIDLLMPGVDGWSILARLKSEPETELIPVIVVSVVEEPNRALILGAVDHLTKPVSRDVLLDSLESSGVQLFRISGLRVLLIGGMEDRLDGYERTLNACGCVVIRVPEPTRDMLRRSPKPNLVILDLAANGDDAATRRTNFLKEAAAAYVAVVAVVPDDSERETDGGILHAVRQQDLARQDRLVRCVWSAAHEPRARPSRLPSRRGDT